MQPLNFQSVRCSMFDVRCSMFLFSIFFLATSSVFGQSATNALPRLLPPRAPLPPTFWEQHGMAVIVGSSIFLGLASVVVWQILKSRPQRVLPPVIVAGEALAKCGARPEDGKVLSEVSQALRRYVCATLLFPPCELTTAEFCRELEHSEKIAPELKRAISDFLRACDERRFSPAASPASLNAAGRALQFIAVIEEEARRPENASATNNERRV